MKSPAKEGQPEAFFCECVCLIGIFDCMTIRFGLELDYNLNNNILKGFQFFRSFSHPLSVILKLNRSF